MASLVRASLKFNTW